MASKDEVQRQLESFLARLEENEASIRSAIPTRKVLRCQVTDLDATWYAVVEDGRVSTPVEGPADTGADISLRLASDDLVDLVEERVSFLSALTSGRVRVDASLGDLLRLRTLL